MEFVVEWFVKERWDGAEVVAMVEICGELAWV
jgi:hypothetical protein